MAFRLPSLGCAVLIALTATGTALAATGPYPSPVAAPVLAPAPRVLVAELRGITKTRQLPSELQRVRLKMIAKKNVGYQDLQALADYGDGLAAYMLGKRLMDMADPTLLDDATHYFAMAAYNGRGAAVRPLVKLLDTAGTGFTPALLSEAQQALEAQAAWQQDLAIKALIRYYSKGIVFPKDAERAQALIERSADTGNTQAAFDIAMSLLSGTPDEAARTDALRYLQIATLSDNLGTRVMAENLLRTLQPDIIPVSDPVTP